MNVSLIFRKLQKLQARPKKFVRLKLLAPKVLKKSPEHDRNIIIENMEENVEPGPSFINVNPA